MIIAIYCQFSDCSEAFCLYAIRHILIDSTFDGEGVVFLLVTGYWLLATGYWLLAIGYWLLAIGYWRLAIGYSLLAIGYWLLATPLFPVFPCLLMR
jgi:hypothetical protein